MPVDVKYLREHYASLSDEALAEIHRADLVAEAQHCYDEEIARRKKELTPISEPRNRAEVDPEVDEESVAEGDEPDWLDEGAEVYSQSARTGSTPGDDIMDAEQALDQAGIPCFLELVEDEERSSQPAPAHRWRVLVPPNLNLRATSILERDIFNSEFEAGWKAQLESFSDEELSEMTPEVAFCGLFDKVERVTKAYAEEIARRKLPR
jgi:hypothetical protein